MNIEDKHRNYAQKHMDHIQETEFVKSCRRQEKQHQEVSEMMAEATKVPLVPRPLVSFKLDENYDPFRSANPLADRENAGKTAVDDCCVSGGV